MEKDAKEFESMRKQLTIGEAAKLVGITPKAIRNYHRLGLLAEPERSEAGYRLYTALELLKMRRIRRLQNLGLSLKRIREIQGGPEGEPSPHTVIGALHSEVCAEIERLERRKRNLEGMMAREDLGDLAEPPAPSPTFERVKGLFAEHLHLISPEALGQEERIWAAVDAFEWPEGHAESHEAVLHHYAENPEAYRDLLAWGERFAALSGKPEDSPEVERLAEEAARHYREHPLPPEFSEAPAWASGPFGEIYSEVVMSELSPGQRRCMALVQNLLGRETR